jgi:hypothetical protein
MKDADCVGWRAVMARGVEAVTPGRQRKYWSQEVTRKSNALDLAPGVFTWSDPKRIAQSLKRSAEVSRRRKGTPLQSAMSMLNFYINRAGVNLDAAQRRILEDAKQELRGLFRGT